MAEWFKTWFDTEEYLLVYKNRNEADALKLVDLVTANINLPVRSKILDMACGTGRHSIILGKKYFVTSVDLSRNLLRIARQNAKLENVKIKFVLSDIRHFAVCTKFDAALNLFTSIGYFENDADNYNIFKDTYSLLNQHGYLVIDFLNSEFIKINIVPQSIDEYPERTIIQQRKISGNRVIKDIRILKPGSEKKYFESVRLYSKDELFSALNRFGFKIIKYFGDYSGQEFDLKSSPRIIIIAGK